MGKNATSVSHGMNSPEAAVGEKGIQGEDPDSCSELKGRNRRLRKRFRRLRRDGGRKHQGEKNFSLGGGKMGRGAEWGGAGQNMERSEAEGVRKGGYITGNESLNLQTRGRT